MQNLLTQRFGLIPKCTGLYTQTQPLPLQKVNVQVNIIHSTAKVLFSQTYVNNTSHLLEVEYYFPIPPGACFDSFQAVYEGTTIQGTIKKKEEAKHEYNKNMTSGNTVAYAEINEDCRDIMKVQIGNIKPSTTIEISFGYIEELDVVSNRFYRYAFSPTFTPRYDPNGLSNNKSLPSILSAYPQLPSKEGHPWSLEAEVVCSSPITHLECLSHEIDTKDYDNPCVKNIKLTASSASNIFDKDFVLLFSEDDFNLPSYRLAKNESGFCAMVSFVPKFSDKPLVEATKEAKKSLQVKQVPISKEEEDNNNNDINLMTATGEYIFLIDRSGSMRGDRIEMAKQALIFGLKSLPINSYFNVYSFGTSFQRLFSKSQKNSEESSEQAISTVKTFEANLGGTDILDPLLEILRADRFLKHPRSVFLLTDGDVSNTQEVLSTIKQNNSTNRVFALGIGNGCSQELVRGCAQNGKGKAEFVTRSEDITGQTISLLSAAITPICDDFSLQFANRDYVTMIAPEPSSQTYLLRNEKATFYIFLSNEAAAQKSSSFEVALKYFDSYSNKYNENVVIVNLDKYETTLDVFKLGILKAVHCLSNQEQSLPKNNPDVYWAGKSSIKEEVVEMSVRNQVLTKETAFICLVKENSGEEIDGLSKVKEIVPQVISIDHKPKIVDRRIGQFSTSYNSYISPMEMKSACISRDIKHDSVSDYSCYATQSVKRSYKAESNSFSAHSYKASNSIKLKEQEEPRTISLLDSTSNINRSAQSPQSASGDGMLSFLSGISSFFTKSSPHPTVEAKSLDQKSTSNTGLRGAYKKQAYRSIVEDKSPDQKSTNNTGLIAVVESQKMEGYWELSDQNLKFINHNKKDLLSKISQTLSIKCTDRVVMTLAVLVWMSKYHQAQKSSWTMIHKKGQQWLDSQGVKYSEVESQVAGFI